MLNKSHHTWMSVNQIIQKHGWSYNGWQPRLQKYHTIHPEWWAFGKKLSWRACFYYHPALVKKVTEERAPKKDEQHKNWLSINQIVGKHGGDYDRWTKQFEEYHDIRPEWWIYVTSGTWQPCYHYHPDLVAKLLRARPIKKKKGWMCTTSMVKTYKWDYMAWYRAAERYRAEHPEWFREMRWNTGLVATYYHPDLVTLLVDEYVLPDDWISITSIRKSYPGAKRLVEWYQKEHPEWFRTVRQAHHDAIYCHPNVAQGIEDVCSAPEWWLSARDLTNKYGWFEWTWKSHLKNHAWKYSDHMKEFVYRRSTRMYYSPKLVAIVLPEMKNVKARWAGRKTPTFWDKKSKTK